MSHATRDKHNVISLLQECTNFVQLFLTTGLSPSMVQDSAASFNDLKL